jgi:hypothetical protein
MSDERVTDHLQSLWQGQPAHDRLMSVDQLRDRSRRLTRIVSRRNMREYVAGGMAIVTCGYLAWKAPLLPLMRAGFLVSVPAVIFVVYHLHRQGASRVMPADMALASCLAFHRGELVRQRDLLRGVWRWYLAPLIPGLILVCLGPALAHPEHAGRALALFAGILAFFALIGEANRYAAKRLQARIDALEKDSFE